MHLAKTADANTPFTSLAVVEDEALAGRSPARLLITASTQQAVESLARRVHSAGPRAGLPFVQTRARDLPTDPHALADNCRRCLDAAAGGSMLISDVEQMPPTVQEALVELLAGLQLARRPYAPARLIAGTTVPLLDRVAEGSFSERLFYQLNVLHLMPGDGPARKGPDA